MDKDRSARPGAPLTREQAAVLIDRLGLIQGEAK